MKKARHFLLISLIIHAIVLVLSIYIVLPMTDISEIRNKLDIYIVKIKPSIDTEIKKNENKTPSKTTPEKKNEIKPEPEKKSESKSPEPEGIKPIDQATLVSLFTTPTINSSRQNEIENKTNSVYMPQLKPPDTANPVTLRRINITDNKQEAVIPALNQKIDNIGVKSGSGGYVLKVGPVGSGTVAKGQSSRYIEAMATVIPRSGSAEFDHILPSIAQGILKRVTQKKLDVVFIVDTTGSMEDNVLGVKDYIHRFLEPLEEKKLDVELGLVTFSDVSARKENVFDLTDKPERFKKWLEKVIFYGGGDLAESGYEAIVTALDKIDFRKSAQRFFVFMSDAPQHDLDYDGKSRYTLDWIISMLNEKNVSVEVIGLDILVMKQLAMGTGGQWKPIPGANLRLDLPESSSVQKIHSSLIVSSIPNFLEDKVVIDFDNPVPDWVDLSYKVLDPQGFKVLGALTYRKDVTNKSEKKIEIPVRLDIREFKSGVYTLIYRTRDSYGNQSILRQTVELQKES
jgi:hypothetical protein